VVRHEERAIATALASLRGIVDEILVVHDGPCADRTLEIATAYGARTFVRPRAGYCEAHFDFAREAARGGWLLQLDADEFLSPPLAASLRALAADPATDGYRLTVRTFYQGRQLRLGIDRTFHALRLFRREKVVFQQRVHGLRTVRGRVRTVRHVLEHRPPGAFLDRAYFAAKVDAWADSNARAIVASGEARAPAFHLLKAYLWFVLHFARLYVLRLYALSGATGLRFSYMMALFNYRTHRLVHERLTR
jgi:glycosyltransferase involved in cell wall biosynthesis